MSAPDLADAVRLLQSGRAEDAEQLLSSLLRAEPQNADALSLLGLAHAQAGDTARAAELMARAIAINPHHAATHFNYANVLRKLERGSEAVDAYARALALRPDHMEARKARGMALAEIGRAAEALSELDMVLRANAGHVPMLTLRAQLRFKAARPGDAIADYDRIVALDPANWQAFNNRGIALDQLERYDEALASYDQALALKPADADALHNRGATLIALQRYDEALPLFEHLIATDPKLADNWSCHGVALSSLNRIEEALASFDRALSLEPDAFRARNGRGMALAALGRTEEAIGEYRAALALEPASAMTHANMAFAMLIAGDLIAGFEEYEWRRKSGPIARAQRTYAQPEWQPGDDIAGKTLLLYPEQGYGDAIHFARFVPILMEKGARIVLEVPAGIETLCRTIAPDAVVVVRSGDPLPPFDLHAPLVSLAHKLRITPDSIPARVPYLLAAPDKRATWAQRLSKLNPGPHVGLCWSGNPVHRNDRARSIALSELATLLDVPGVAFVSLQRDVRASDAAALAALPIVQVTEHIADFSDTAALVAELDLVVTVDTSIAHLAGALAKPVWIMIPTAPDWRWLRERHDSPWYPTARLFRQREPENWKPVLADIREALQKLATTGL